MQLDPEQQSAATQNAKNVLVLAGPGTGVNRFIFPQLDQS